MNGGVGCLLCGSPKTELHHITGRGLDRRQLDPDLVAALCRRHHDSAHAYLRSQRLDVPPDVTWSPAAALTHRLHRTGVHFGLLSIHSDEPSFERLAAHFRAWARELGGS